MYSYLEEQKEVNEDIEESINEEIDTGNQSRQFQTGVKKENPFKQTRTDVAEETTQLPLTNN